MKAYMFEAALWCGPCIRQIMLDSAMVEANFDHSNHDPEAAMESMLRANGFKSGDSSEYDSDKFPKGPFANGGGEADTPQHCDGCGCFLENPLTEDGLAYVIEALNEDFAGDPQVKATWRDFYANDYYKGLPLHEHLIPGHYSHGDSA